MNVVAAPSAPVQRFCHMCGSWYFPQRNAAGTGFVRRHDCTQHARVTTQRDYGIQYRAIMRRGYTPAQRAARAAHTQLLAEARQRRRTTPVSETVHTGPGGRPEGTTGIRWRGKEA